jgi:hypothetical protein
METAIKMPMMDMATISSAKLTPACDLILISFPSSSDLCGPESMGSSRPRRPALNPQLKCNIRTLGGRFRAVGADGIAARLGMAALGNGTLGNALACKERSRPAESGVPGGMGRPERTGARCREGEFAMGMPHFARRGDAGCQASAFFICSRREEMARNKIQIDSFSVGFPRYRERLILGLLFCCQAIS